MEENEVFRISEEDGEAHFEYGIDLSNPQQLAMLLELLTNSRERLKRTLEIMGERDKIGEAENAEIIEQLRDELEEAEGFEDIWTKG